MNILLLAPTLADPGGTQRMVADLGRLLASKHTVWECSFDGDNEPAVFPSGNPRLSLHVARPTGVWSRAIGYARKAIALRRIKREHEIDVTVSALWPADLVNVLAMGRGRRISLGVVNVVGNFQNARMLRHRAFVAWIYRRFHRTIAINEALQAELRDLYALDPARVGCIHPFVDTRESTPAAHRDAGRRIAWFGRLNPIKNLQAMIDILARLKERVDGVHLVVIGEGPQRADVIAACTAAGLRVGFSPEEMGQADVVFLGFVDDPSVILRAADVFALTSTSEGFGLVLVEAMAAGLAIVASDCPTGGPHAIMQGRRPYRPFRDDMEETPYGFLVPVPQSNEASGMTLWLEALQSLLSRSELRRQKAANSVRRARDFSLDQLGGVWLSAIESA